MLDERKLISQLESDIEQYDQIFLVSEDRTLLREAVSVLCRLQEPVGSNRKRLILVTSDTESEDMLALIPESVPAGHVIWRRISQKEVDALCSLYDSYEFSDRFHILSREEQYGGMLNFVDTGILSTEEMIEALLH